MSDRGQGIMLDLLIGAIIFMLVLMSINGFWVGELNSIDDNIESNEMNLIAFNAIEGLVTGQGSPNGWETLPEASVNEIGLIEGNRVIEENKLVAFQNMSYNLAREKLKIRHYDFFFEFEGIDDVNAGLPPMGNADKVVIYRKASYKGVGADVKFTLYNLR
ncbi:MAG: hypothetical protein ABID38_05120 [Candidatus Diapherotrites archaeon]